MRASSRFSRSVTLVLVLTGTGSLLVLLVVLITGGFVIDAGPMHFSSRRLTMPLGLAAIAWLAAALVGGWSGVAATLTALREQLDHRSVTAAIVVAVAAAAAGIGYGTYSASGADASGSVSQAELLASGRVSRDEALARLLPWPQSTWVFSPLGYRPGPGPAAGEVVPTYPPGLPLTMAAARAVGGEWAPYFVVPLFGGLAVFCTYLLGVRLHSRTAGLVAACFMATSPIFLFQLVQPMSDVPALAWWTAALWLALSSQPGAPLAAGVAAGLALLARPNLVPLLAPLALVVCGWPRVPAGRAPWPVRRLSAFVAGLVPAGLTLALFQWRLYGHPLASGHGAFNDFFSLSNIWPNVLEHSQRLLRGEMIVIGMTVVSFVVVVAARRSRRNMTHPALRSRSPPLRWSVPPSLCATCRMWCSQTGSTCDFSSLRFRSPLSPPVRLLHARWQFSRHPVRPWHFCYS